MKLSLPGHLDGNELGRDKPQFPTGLNLSAVAALSAAAAVVAASAAGIAAAAAVAASLSTKKRFLCISVNTLSIINNYTTISFNFDISSSFI